MIPCPGCGQEIDSSSRFCPHCAVRICPGCCSLLPPRVKYCPHCGFAVGPALTTETEQPPPSPSARPVPPPFPRPVTGEKHPERWQTAGGYITGQQDTYAQQAMPVPHRPEYPEGYRSPDIPAPATAQFTPDHGTPRTPIPSPYSGIQPPLPTRPRMPNGPIPARRFPKSLVVLVLIILGFSLLSFAAFNAGWLESPIDAVQRWVSGLEWTKWLPSAAKDSIPPIISNVKVESVTSTGAVITWQTDEPSTSQVMVCDPSGSCTWTELDKTLVVTHSVSLSGLKPNVNYKFTATSTDAKDNQTVYEGEFKTLPGAAIASLLISGVTVSNITDSSATISWKTDKPASSQVEYGTTDAYGSVTPLDTKLTTSHSMTLSGLSPSMTYHFRVKSKDSSGNEAASSDQTFTTRGTIAVAAETGPEIGKRAPDFTLTSLDGKAVTLSSFRGKVVILKFWVDNQSARNELPIIQAFYEKSTSKEWAILAINWKQTPDDVKKFTKEKGITFPILLDVEGQVATKYRVSPSVHPTSFLIDSVGTIKDKRDAPFRSEEQLENIIKSLQ